MPFRQHKTRKYLRSFDSRYYSNSSCIQFRSTRSACRKCWPKRTQCPRNRASSTKMLNTFNIFYNKLINISVKKIMFFKIDFVCCLYVSRIRVRDQRGGGVWCRWRQFAVFQKRAHRVRIDFGVVGDFRQQLLTRILFVTIDIVVHPAKIDQRKSVRHSPKHEKRRERLRQNAYQLGLWHELASMNRHRWLFDTLCSDCKNEATCPRWVASKFVLKPDE